MAGRDADGRTPRGVRGLKSLGYPQIHTRCPSHPSRGAWIEISATPILWVTAPVAPLAGCVD